jgi:hypothetical protein
LLGQAVATAPNAQGLQMTAVFRIETVEEDIWVPPFKVDMPHCLLAHYPLGNIHFTSRE